MLDSLYTDDVKTHIYNAKARLPKDFPLTLIEREMYESGNYDTIIIEIPVAHFDWRTVEDRLAIALVLERLKELIRGEGIPCLIEKPKPEDA